MPDDKYDEFVAEATEAAKAIKARAENRSIKAQRATVPGLGGHPETRAMNLGDLDRRFLAYVRGQVSPSEMKALVEDDTGRILVSPEVEREIGVRLQEEVILRQLATVKPTTKDRIEVRELETEPTAEWGVLETGSNVPESSLKPKAAKFVHVCDLNSLTKVGVDELMDSDEDLAYLVAEIFAKVVAEKEDEGFISGVGWDAGKCPEGIITNATLLSNATRTGSAASVTVEDMLDLVYSVPKRYRRNGSFIVHSATELALRKLRARGGDEAGGNEGPFLWLPSVAVGMPNTFLGRPIYTDDCLGTLAGTEEVIAIYGDFRSGYVIYDRLGTSIQRLSELYAEANLVGFKLHKRVAGYVKMPQNKPLALLREKAEGE